MAGKKKTTIRAKQLGFMSLGQFVPWRFSFQKKVLTVSSTSGATGFSAMFFPMFCLKTLHCSSLNPPPKRLQHQLPAERLHHAGTKAWRCVRPPVISQMSPALVHTPTKKKKRKRKIPFFLKLGAIKRILFAQPELKSPAGFLLNERLCKKKKKLKKTLRL